MSTDIKKGCIALLDVHSGEILNIDLPNDGDWFKLSRSDENLFIQRKDEEITKVEFLDSKGIQLKVVETGEIETIDLPYDCDYIHLYRMDSRLYALVFMPISVGVTEVEFIVEDTCE